MLESAILYISGNEKDIKEYYFYNV